MSPHRAFATSLAIAGALAMLVPVAAHAQETVKIGFSVPLTVRLPKTANR